MAYTANECLDKPASPVKFGYDSHFPITELLNTTVYIGSYKSLIRYRDAPFDLGHYCPPLR